jgi:hypothetical protein
MRTPPKPSRHFVSFSVFVNLLTIALLIAFGAVPAEARPRPNPAQQMTCSPYPVRFGGIMIGESEILSITMTNPGPDSATIYSVNSDLSAFTVSGINLPLTLAAGQSTNFDVTFTPTTTGWQGEPLTVTSTVSPKWFCTGVEGRGVVSQNLIPKPTSLSFGNVNVGSSSTIPMTLYNQGWYNIEVSEELTSGAGISISGLNMPVIIGPRQSLTFNVTFAPQSAGAVNGLVNLTSTGLTIPVTGSGISSTPGQLQMAPASLSYGNVDVGTTSTQSVTMSANGASITINSAASNNSQFALQGVSFPVTIPGGQSASFVVAFTPTVSGAQSGALSFSTTAPNSPMVEAASGVGVTQTYNVGLSWNASNSQNVSGYNVYRAVYSNACGSFSKINSSLNQNTSYTDNTVSSGTTYCYATTAVNSSNEESGYSNQAQVVIP